MPNNQHEINVRVDSSLYQLESILESLQGLVQGGLASFFRDFEKVDPRRVEHLKYLMDQLNQSQASRGIGDSLKNITEQMESIVSALDVSQKIKAPVIERGFPQLVKNLDDAIQKHYESINKYISELFSATYIANTPKYLPGLLRSTRGDVATQLSAATRRDIIGYLDEFEKSIDAGVRQRYADYFDRFKTVQPPPIDTSKASPTNTIPDKIKETLFGPGTIPQVDFKVGNEAVANYTISQNKIGIGKEFANLSPKTKNFVLQHELGHSIFTRFQSLFPQRFEEILHSGVVGTWEEDKFQGVFGHERTSPHETLADLYAYYMSNPQRMRKSHPEQYSFIDQFLNQEIFQNDVLNFAYRKLTKRQESNVRKLYATGEYTKTALAKKYGISTKTLNRILKDEPPTTTKPEPTTTKPEPTTTKPEPTTTKPEPTTTKPEPAATTIENITPQWREKPYTSIPVLKPPTTQPLITPDKEVIIPQPPSIIIPQEPPKVITTPSAEEVKKYGSSTIPKEEPPKEKPKQTTEVPNRALEMMNRWLEKEYQVSAQLLKESRDGKKDSQKQAFDLKHLLSIATEARLEAVAEAQRDLESIYVATKQDRPLTETFLRENIAETTRTKTASQISTLLQHQGLQPYQVRQLTDKYMKLIEDSLPPPPTPPTVGGWGEEWDWGGAARSIGKYALNRGIGGMFNALDIIVDKAGLSLSDILSRGMTINENLYYPLEMAMAGRMGRLMRAGTGGEFSEEFYTTMQEMWGQAIPMELAGTLMSQYTALLGSTTMENLADQIIPLTNIARTTGIAPEQLLQPVAGMLRMMPERGTPQVYTQLSESIAKAISNADLTKAIGTDELLRIFTTLSKNYFSGAAEITPKSVQNALSAVGFLTNFGAPGLQGAVGLENLAKLNQSLQGKGVNLTPLLYLGANPQAKEWGTNTLEKMVNISSRFAQEGIFMRNEGTDEIFLFSLLRRVEEMTGGDRDLSTAILAHEGNISPNIAQALFNLQDTLKEQLGTGRATPENLTAVVNAIVQGDQKAYEVMTKGTELEQMQYYQLLEANTIYEQLTKDAGLLPLQIAMQGKKQLSPLLDKVYSALAEGVQGNIRGAFNQLVQAFQEVPEIDKEGASLMAYSTLRNAGMTPQNLTGYIQQALPSALGTTIGVAAGASIAKYITAAFPYLGIALAGGLAFYYTKDFFKEGIEKRETIPKERKELHTKTIPELREEEIPEEKLKQYIGVYETIIARKNTPWGKDLKPRKEMLKGAIGITDFDVLLDVWDRVQGTEFEEPYREILEITGDLKRIQDSAKTATFPTSPISEPVVKETGTVTIPASTISESVAKETNTVTIPTSPISEPVVKETDKAPTSTPPSQTNNTTYYYFTINATPLPGETPEQMSARIANQILQAVEEAQVTNTRNRSGGQ